MAKVEVTVEHSLGASEAMRRIRAAAEDLRREHGSLVKEFEWTGDGARVVGKGFEGNLRVGESNVKVEAELGFPASLMPLKAKREGEEWLRKLLA